MSAFPTPNELRQRYETMMGFSLDDEAAKPLLTKYSTGEDTRRYYQDAAIRAALEKIARCERQNEPARVLLSLATGAGKTFIAVNLLKRILVGAVVLVRQTRPRLMLSDKTLRLVTKQDCVVKEYLEVALRQQKARDFIEGNATGTSPSMKNISQKTIEKIPVLLPPVLIQEKIAFALKQRQPSIDNLRKTVLGQIGTINALPASLLRQAFNGEYDRHATRKAMIAGYANN
ncbi:DEAD/DEAH box helicase family protein [Nodosilinea sp. PGN35]|uniref:DEAD/DEAH box helicase family protein n=1 Tax=Nodosilinea sp. PGN35 TaxID=3020489 RepID=UPI0023B22936|nr:DEAD/DEAH box helicase family protein [Nodosilinea sp. TSF1-S3]MDF0370195.1 DEAD/DEAH box helicase family protein [Nodosilinea sp. TSF1-S3]